MFLRYLNFKLTEQRKTRINEAFFVCSVNPLLMHIKNQGSEEKMALQVILKMVSRHYIVFDVFNLLPKQLIKKFTFQD